MRIKFIELFAGIGGFRIGFEQACASLGLKPECIFSSEIDKFARQTYAANFSEEPAGDITKISSADIYIGLTYSPAFRHGNYNNFLYAASKLKLI